MRGTLHLPLLVLLIGLLCLLVYKMNYGTINADCPSQRAGRAEEVKVNPTQETAKGHIQERNHLSRIMNSLRKEIKKQYCDLLKLKGEDAKKETDQSGTMGYCFHATNTSLLLFDKNLARAMADLMEGQRVAGFGDVQGMYKRQMDVLTRVATYDSYDDNPYIENNTESYENPVKFLDLTVPQYGLPAYDWVVCLKLGEHAPHTFKDGIVDNIARHARVGVILSWALPSQRGDFDLMHGYRTEVVDDIMKKEGFSFDEHSSRTLADAVMRPWLRDRVRVYERDAGVKFDEDET